MPLLLGLNLQKVILSNLCNLSSTRFIFDQIRMRLFEHFTTESKDTREKQKFRNHFLCENSLLTNNYNALIHYGIH